MKSKRKSKRVVGCTACGKLWAEHQGIAGTCARLMAARRALNDIIFDVWASKATKERAHKGLLESDDERRRY